MNDNEQSATATSVSEETVIWAYRLLLGREPENADVVSEQARASPNWRALRHRLLHSPEFMNALPAWSRFTLRGIEPSIRIDCDGAPETLNRLFEHVNHSWQELGEADPFYSVLTQPEFRGIPHDEGIRHFFESGNGDVEKLQKTLARSGLEFSGRRVCLEYGCGLGRVTRALAPHFERTIGVDISRAHLALAERYAREAGLRGIEWRQLTSVADLDALPQVDMIYSMMVLQHNPPPVIDRIIATFARVLKPGGIAYFQLPTYRLGYSFDLRHYLESKIETRGLEMHVYPQDRVFAHFDEAGVVPINVVEDDATGGAFERSNTFLFLRK